MLFIFMSFGKIRITVCQKSARFKMREQPSIV